MKFYKSLTISQKKTRRIPITQVKESPKPLTQENGEAIKGTVQEQVRVFRLLEASQTIRILHDWYDILTYQSIVQTIEGLREQFEKNNVNEEAWLKSLTEALNKTRKDFIHIVDYVEGEEKIMAQPNLLKDISIEELKRLHPIESLQGVVIENEDTHNFLGLFEDIKLEIKKGTKVSYKMIQELQNQLEFVLTQVGQEDASTLETAATSDASSFETSEEIEQLKKRSDQSVELILKAIDTLDLIRNAADQAKLEESWIMQIDQATESFIGELEMIGIREVKTKGALLDGNYMISIGTVPMDVAVGYERFQVYVVHERGFMNSNTGEVIREAKVINVY